MMSARSASSPGLPSLLASYLKSPTAKLRGLGFRAAPTIAAGSERPTERFQVPANLQIIVYLAIEHYPQSPIVAGHRLVPGRRKIQNAQSPMTQGHTIRLETDLTGAVRPTVSDVGDHGADIRGARDRLNINDSCDATHNLRRRLEKRASRHGDFVTCFH